MGFKHWFAGIAALITMSAADVAHAVPSDPAIEGAKECTQYFSRHEREYGIPIYLLAAIASTESGRWHQGLGMALPWPWTINVEGKGYYFATKNEAVEAVRKLHSRGISSIDVGCMQVNLHHHPNAFANLDQAFDPAFNVAYAASFLRTNYDEEKSWKKAAADYHSKTPERGNEYVGHVFNNWNTIINKVAEARGGKVNYASNQFTLPKFSSSTDIALETKERSVKAQSQALQPFKKPHMHVIKVSRRDTKRENGVLVIRPTYNKAPKQEAKKEAPAQDILVGGTGPSSNLIKVSATAPVSPKSNGPNFIFNN